MDDLDHLVRAASSEVNGWLRSDSVNLSAFAVTWLRQLA